MQDALFLLHILRGPLRTLARDWMCRGLRRSAFRGSSGLDRYCPACATTKTNEGRVIAIGSG